MFQQSNTEIKLPDDGSAADKDRSDPGSLRIRVMQSLEPYEQHIDILAEMHAESGIGQKHVFEQERVDVMVKQLLERPKSAVILLAEWKGELVGFIVCTLNSFLSAGAAQIAHVQLLYITRRWRKSIQGGKALLALVRAAITWSKSRNAVEIRVELTEEAMNTKLTKLLMRSGFRVGGVSLVRGCGEAY